MGLDSLPRAPDLDGQLRCGFLFSVIFWKGTELLRD